MRRQTPLAHRLYAHLYPHPSANDPPNFSAHLARHLVPEVRIEVATFYGDLNSAEARYPGLNYCHAPHRMRLGRFKHHRRLFDAFDALGLTEHEIQEFCCWEGTKWARERYEKDEGVTVLDTTGDEIGPFVDPRHLRRGPADDRRRKSITRQTDISVVVEEAGPPVAASPPRSQPDRASQAAHADHQSAASRPDRYAHEADEEDDEDEDEEMSDADTPTPTNPTASSSSTTAASSSASAHPSVAEAFVNRQVIQAWEMGWLMPRELEAWLKEQSEQGTLSPHLDLRRLHPSRNPALMRRAAAAAAAAAATSHASAAATNGSSAAARQNGAGPTAAGGASRVSRAMA